jgi:hypothetical protein
VKFKAKDWEVKKQQAYFELLKIKLELQFLDAQRHRGVYQGFLTKDEKFSSRDRLGLDNVSASESRRNKA